MVRLIELDLCAETDRAPVGDPTACLNPPELFSFWYPGLPRLSSRASGLTDGAIDDPIPSRVFIPEYILLLSMEAERAPIAREGDREAVRASVLTSVAMSEGRPRRSRDTDELERAPVAPDGSLMPWGGVTYISQGSFVHLVNCSSLVHVAPHVPPPPAAAQWVPMRLPAFPALRCTSA